MAGSVCLVLCLVFRIVLIYSLDAASCLPPLFSFQLEALQRQQRKQMWRQSSSVNVDLRVVRWSMHFFVHVLPVPYNKLIRLIRLLHRQLFLPLMSSGLLNCGDPRNAAHREMAEFVGAIFLLVFNVSVYTNFIQYMWRKGKGMGTYLRIASSMKQ